MHLLKHIFGLDNPLGEAYLFWSGAGGYLLAISSGLYGFVKLHRQRDKHHQQLKDHIDYKFSKFGKGVDSAGR